MFQHLETLEGRAESLADLIELSLLRDNLTSASTAAVREKVADVASNEMTELGLNVMQRRERVLRNSYPYRLNAIGVRRSETPESLPYIAMLLFSQRRAPFRTNAGALQKAAILFESLTVRAMIQLLGPSAEAIRFAWPSEEGRPPNFPDAVRWLAGRMGVPVGSAFRPPRRQDGGVDVVAWRPFPDGQPGFPIFLTQCTLERDFVHKSADIDLRVWAGWLAFDIDPTCVLAIPFTVESAEDWREMATRVIVLDRLRLSTLLAEAFLPEELAPWVNDELTSLRED